MTERLTAILAIASTDSSGGAGINADIRTGVSEGVHVQTAVCGVTAQSTSRFGRVMPVPGDMIRAQIEAAISDLLPVAVKIGLVPTPGAGGAIAEALCDLLPGVPVVTDTILSPTAHGEFAARPGLIREMYLNTLLPVTTVATPNIPELHLLTGSDDNNIVNMAQRLSECVQTPWVVVKGGHACSSTVCDTLVGRGDVIVAEHDRLECGNLHGTGCVFSTLLACALAKGHDVPEAFRHASTRLHAIIKNSCHYTYGPAANGLLNINLKF